MLSETESQIGCHGSVVVSDPTENELKSFY